MASQRGQIIRVGYALSPEKIHSLIKPSFIHLAKERGIELIPIEPSKPLIEQGPFDCIIHKLFDPDWIRQLRILSSRRPDCAIFDRPERIKPLHSRITMLEVVDRIAVSPPYSVGVPRQAFVEDPDEKSTIPDWMNFPIIVKPAASDGSPSSHEMRLVFGRDGFEASSTRVAGPCVLQEFVNHGGVLFKVYVAGRHVQCMKRRSLVDIPGPARGSDASGDMVQFSQISNVRSSRSRNGGGGGGIVNAAGFENAELPPAGLKLNLFNFDLIRDARHEENRFLVIDINYFPGFSKLVDYERFLTDFFIDLVRYPTERWGS